MITQARDDGHCNDTDGSGTLDRREVPVRSWVSLPARRGLPRGGDGMHARPVAEIPPDPHVHAEAHVVGVAQRRARLSRAIGRAVSIPTTVPTGCGQRRPLAATSPIPERVTCLPCRDHARRAHDAFATALESVPAPPVADPAVVAHTAAEVRRHRDLARRFGSQHDPG
jgi:hypothetical protein